MLTESELETARDPEWEVNFKIGLKEVGRSYADWIDLARIGTSDGAVSTLINSVVAYKAGYLLTS